MGKEDVGEGLFSIFHGEKLVLVDGDGNIRGYYDADDDGVATLIRDADVLLNLRDWGPGSSHPPALSVAPQASRMPAASPSPPAKIPRQSPLLLLGNRAARLARPAQNRKGPVDEAAAKPDTSAKL